MKKNVLLFTALLLGLTFSSCLNMDVDEQFYGNDFAYITKNASGVQIARIYNKNLGFLAITSDEIQDDLELGECYFLYYKWSSEMGTLTGEDMTVFEAELLGDPVFIEKESLNLCLELPAVNEDSIQYFSMRPRAYDSGVYSFFDDNWLIEFSYQGKKGEVGKLEFYLLEEQPIDDEYIVDVVLTKSGEGEGSSNKITDHVVINMSKIRDFYPSAGSSFRDVGIKFRFYSSDNDELYTTSVFPMRVFSN